MQNPQCEGINQTESFLIQKPPVNQLAERARFFTWDQFGGPNSRYIKIKILVIY